MAIITKPNNNPMTIKLGQSYFTIFFHPRLENSWSYFWHSASVYPKMFDSIRINFKTKDLLPQLTVTRKSIQIPDINAYR